MYPINHCRLGKYKFYERQIECLTFCNELLSSCCIQMAIRGRSSLTTSIGDVMTANVHCVSMFFGPRGVLYMRVI